MSQVNVNLKHHTVAAGMLLALLAACGGGSTANAPAITSQPSEVTVVEGQSATFRVTTSGAAATYQWAKNGTAIAGATAASYTTDPTTSDDDKAIFTVTATNGHQSVKSAEATLHVNFVRITSSPQNLNVASGDHVSFSVTATASGTLGYQWLKDGANIPEATSATLDIAAALPENAGTYGCVVTSTLNGTTATASCGTATVAVVAQPTIGMQPVSETVAAGDSATLSVTATGSGEVTYQWQKDGVDIPGATSSTLTIDSTSADSAGVYTCVVTNTDQGVSSSTTSMAATLTVAVPPTLMDSGDITIPAGNNATLSVTATTAPGMSAPTYQWRHDGSDITGATGAKYTIGAATTSDAGSYTCVVTSSINGVAAAATSNPMKVTVVSRPVITTQPTGGTLNSGGSLTLTVVATADNQIGYQWQRKGLDIPGATSASYTIPSATAKDAGDYTCVVSNTLNGVAATTTSSSATVVVKAAPVLTTQPADQTVLEQQTATFTVVAAGSGLTYQWLRDGSPIPGATTPSYTTPTLQLADSGATFSCVVSNGYLPDSTTRSAALTVNPIPPVFEASATQIVQGEGVILTYSFLGTATLKLGGAGRVSVTSGGNTVVYPLANTTYTLAVTRFGITTPMTLTVAVKNYVPKHLYSANYGSRTITRFDVTFGSTMFSNTYHIVGTSPTGVGPIHIATSPDEKLLYVANRESADISAFTVDQTTGALVAITGSPFPLGTDASPFASVVDPSGQHLYVAGNDAVSVFSINATTGVLTRAPTLDVAISGRSEGDLLMHPSGKFLFVADYMHNVVKSYSVNPATGALTFVAEVSASGGPRSMTFDRAATRIFVRGVVTGNQNAVIHVFGIDPYTGALTAMSHYQGFNSTSGLPFVRGTEFPVKPADPMASYDPYFITYHGLVYSKKPGVDVLYNGYHGEDVTGTSMSAYNVNTASGTVTGDFANTALPGSPFATGGWLYHSVAGSIAIDRGGSLIFLGSTLFNGNALAYLSSATGVLSGPTLAIGGIPEYYLVPGLNPAHAVFTGELQAVSDMP